MASVKFQRKEFEKHIRLTREIEERISLFGTHLESITEDEIEIEVLPNRPDLFSLQGFIRAISAFIGKNTGLKKYSVSSSGEKMIVEKSVPKEWPFAYACIVKGIEFDNEKIREVIQMQEKLGTTLLRNRKKGGIGIYPLEKINFPVSFKGMKPDEIKFRPLEYPEAITGRQILSKHPTGREYSHLVSSLNSFPVFVDKKGIIMSMPPIINSHDVGKIDEKTRDVFVECTGTDQNALKKVLIIILTALAELGGKIYSLECHQKSGEKENFPNLTPEKKKISLENVNTLLGLSLKEKDIAKLLSKMGYEYKKGSVSVPAWRADVLHEVDIIEDIAIAYGYDKLVPVMPEISTIGEESKQSKIKNKIREALIGLGLIEISSYHLIKQDEGAYMPEESRIEVESSKTEYKFLRPSLLLPALRIMGENKDNEYPQKLFEIGPVFSKDAKAETGIREQENILIVLSPASFTEVKQVLDNCTSALSTTCTLKEEAFSYLIEGRTAALMQENEKIGYMGELHPETLRAWNIKMPMAVIELKLDAFIK